MTYFCLESVNAPSHLVPKATDQRGRGQHPQVRHIRAGGLDGHPGRGAAGTVYYTLQFTNLSGQACTLHGSPEVSAVSLSGRRLGSPAGGDYSGDTPVVTLASGATAYALLGYSDVTTSNNFSKTVAAGLRVYPPNDFVSKVIPFPITVCTRSGLVYMHVAAVQATPPPGSGL